MKTYIDETLLKTFKMIKNKYIKDPKLNQKFSEGKNDFYFVDSENADIVHLLMGRENSEAGDTFNDITLDYLKKQIQTHASIKPFNVIESVTTHLVNCSTELMEVESRIKNFNDIEIKDDLIKLNSDKRILLKKCLVDELGFSKFYGNVFTPNYQSYKTDNSLVISIDIPDIEECVIPEPTIVEKYRIFTVKGTKSVKSQEKIKLEKKLPIEDKREIGNFFLEYSVPVEDANITSEPPSRKYDRGVLTISYKLTTKWEKGEIVEKF